MPTLELHGMRVRYVDEGEGPDAVLLLHAFPLNAAMWREEIAALAARHRVIAPDFPGFGGSSRRVGVSEMRSLAADAVEWAARLGVSRAAVVGLSMGGYVALEVVRERPEFVRALVLADTRAGADTPEGVRGREEFAARVLKEGVGWVADALRPKLLGPRADAAIVAAVRAMISAATPDGIAAAQRGMATRRDSSAVLASIRCPTLIVVGSEDALTPPPESRAIAAAVPRARLVEIPGVGHLSNLEASDAFNRELRAFLEALPA